MQNIEFLNEKLIGAQLVSINESEIVISKDGIQYNIQIDEDGGDCCGYSSVEANLLVDSDDLKRNPVITKIEIIEEDDSDESVVKLTLFGEYAPMAKIDTCSGSGSGWCYGACVTLECKELGLRHTLSCW